LGISPNTSSIWGYAKIFNQRNPIKLTWQNPWLLHFNITRVIDFLLLPITPDKKY
jgi:hypothetical protein